MKQIIEKNSNGDIQYKHYVNHLGKFYGLAIWYFRDGNIQFKTNYKNDKLFGLYIGYQFNGKPEKITYHL